MIVLLTDFQEYANVMKAVMRSLSPSIKFMDLNNNIDSYNIIQGAWKLYANYHYFPKGSIFLCVVDPGVGSNRKGVIIHTKDYVFIGPDNGLMYTAAKDNGIFRVFGIDYKKVKVIAKGVFHRKYNISKTFHGRDVFGLVAASLENKFTMDFMGKIISLEHKLDLFPKEREGLVVDIDNFGNIIVNIFNENLKRMVESSEKLLKENKFPHSIKIKVKNTIRKINLYSYYDQAKKTEIFGILNSQKVLEIAKKQSNANKLLKVKIGDKVSLI